MNNSEIIMQNSVLLYQQGILKITADGAIEQIHTFQAWRQLGFLVKKGEHAIAKFPIWNYAKKPPKDAIIDEFRPHYYMKMSSFFTESQVELIHHE